jgi:hypothetical protein
VKTAENLIIYKTFTVQPAEKAYAPPAVNVKPNIPKIMHIALTVEHLV